MQETKGGTRLPIFQQSRIPQQVPSYQKREIQMKCRLFAHLIQQKEVDKFIFIFAEMKQRSEDDERSSLCRLMKSEEIKRNHNSASYCSVVRGLIS